MLNVCYYNIAIYTWLFLRTILMFSSYWRDKYCETGSYAVVWQVPIEWMAVSSYKDFLITFNSYPGLLNKAE